MSPKQADSPPPANQTPPPDNRHHTALLTGLFGFLLVYTLSDWLGAPKPIYLPVETRFTFSPPPDAIKMGYFGLLLNGFAGFFIGYAVARLPKLSQAIHTHIGQAKLATLNLFALGGGMLYFLIVELTKWGSS